MFGKKTKSLPPVQPRRVASQLEEDIKLVGDLSFSGLLQLKGNVYGNIISPPDSEATLLIEEGATVTGEIRVPYIQIKGKVTGNVFASHRISIKTGSTVIGDVHYNDIELDQGAHLSGHLISMKEAKEELKS
ncbi:bactofilin family protein [Leucothrix arctica]|uniref:Polymer-forming cytoskeletal protein n=1 Tax=Leucothrix arctica TaxID=1481894 RepID=A0A317C6S3_9GAMM|nr:polymer-forming cytoskeletal protein [Leucothrix arctica]PWQ93911.1 polymer-forming cytoskeletal protein [Leucothrix arctica]